MKTRRNLAFAALATALGIVAVPTGANAALECKSSALTGMGVTSSAMVDNWRTTVTNAYGAAWANFSNAAGKTYGELNLVLIKYQTVSARPCRPRLQLQVNPNLLKQLHP